MIKLEEQSMLKQESFKAGVATLYLVSTPIGNLADITIRAQQILNEVDFILAEDTRVTLKLLNHYQINKQLISYHDHSDSEKENYILNLLEQGKNLALVTDAGTPGISDPGYELSSKAIKAGFNVVAIPGASAMLTALVSSGLLVQPFSFIGFLPRKQSLMEDTLKLFEHLNHTIIIYESANRIDQTLQIIYKILKDRRVAVCRELTKKFETIIRGSLSEIVNVKMDGRGEYVIIVEKQLDSFSSLSHLSIQEHIRHYLKSGYSEKDALKLVAKDRKVTKNEIYKVYKIK